MAPVALEMKASLLEAKPGSPVTALVMASENWWAAARGVPVKVCENWVAPVFLSTSEPVRPPSVIWAGGGEIDRRAGGGDHAGAVEVGVDDFGGAGAGRSADGDADVGKGVFYDVDLGVELRADDAEEGKEEKRGGGWFHVSG